MRLPELAHLREGHADCPSDFALDQLRGGDLPREEATAIEAHIEDCDACPGRMALRRQGFAAHPEADPMAMLEAIQVGLASTPDAAPLQSRGGLQRWWRELTAGLMGLAAVAAAFTLVIAPNTGSQPDAGVGTVRTKGSASLHVFRQEGDRSREMVSGERFEPGDKIRFSVDLDAPARVQVIGVEASGTLYTAWPSSPAHDPGVLPAGKGQLLKGAVELDSAPGKEKLYLVHCEPEVSAPACNSRGADTPPACAAGCRLSPFVINKGK